MGQKITSSNSTDRGAENWMARAKRAERHLRHLRAVARDTRLSPEARNLYAILDDFGRSNGYAWPKNRTLCKLMGRDGRPLDERTLKRYLAELIELGYVKKTIRRATGETNLYYLGVASAAGCANEEVADSKNDPPAPQEMSPPSPQEMSPPMEEELRQIHKSSSTEQATPLLAAAEAPTQPKEHADLVKALAERGIATRTAAADVAQIADPGRIRAAIDLFDQRRGSGALKNPQGFLRGAYLSPAKFGIDQAGGQWRAPVVGGAVRTGPSHEEIIQLSMANQRRILDELEATQEARRKGELKTIREILEGVVR